MANNTNTATGAQDVVGVFNQQTSVQVFDQALPIKASVSGDTQVMTHPLENGEVIVDHKIILPITIQLSLILTSEDFRSVYRSIKELNVNSTLLTVQTRSGVYRNMIISSIPHDETPEVYDGISLALTLTEVQFAKTAISSLVSSPLNPADSNTLNGGKKQTNQQTTDRKSSVLRSLLQ